MVAIEIVVGRPRRWQTLIIERLRRAGHTISIVATRGDSWSPAIEALLRPETMVFLRGGDALSSPVSLDFPQQPTIGPADLRLDLAGTAASSPVPTLRLLFDGNAAPAAAIATLARGELPELAVSLDGRAIVATASPMVDRPYSVVRSLEDVLARAVTLMIAAVSRFEAGTLQALDLPFRAPRSTSVIAPYVFSALPRLGREVLRRRRYRQAHWRVGYRFIEGPGVAETGELGSGWWVLPDDGTRFYADPFAFNWHGRSYLFIEDFSHASGKAVISVVAFDEHDRPRVPQPILEEPWHLSYPQVFARDGAIWMLPEGSGGKSLVLYRADDFPLRWVRHTVLIEDCELSDATLLEHGGRLWLFATDRDGFGSTSDLQVVFHAERLEGPWLPHERNPIRIDRTAARPGGAFIRVGDTTLLPLQDGTTGYGGGLGLSPLLELDEDIVTLGNPAPIATAGDWPYPQIHTLNRAGRLEVIDGIAAVKKV